LLIVIFTVDLSDDIFLRLGSGDIHSPGENNRPYKRNNDHPDNNLREFAKGTQHFTATPLKPPAIIRPG
jgi:hypothetical protein